MIVTGSGTRKAQLYPVAKKQALVQQLTHVFEKVEPSRLIVGGSEGFDEALCHTARLFGVPYTLALPDRNYLQKYWALQSITGKDRLDKAQQMVEQADQVLYLDRGNRARTIWMLDQSDHCILMLANLGHRIMDHTVIHPQLL
jgi:histidinol-phosphate/aromatic aminotransferase/cobyric acid decarboxylase-like protein